MKTIAKINVVTAPALIAPNAPHPWVFLAGGITGCPDWQEDLLDLFREGFKPVFNGTFINPRRPDFDVTEKGISEQQVIWEFNYLKECDLVSFWFPKDTLCPITLYELGRVAESKKSMVVGVQPGYARDFDVRFQLALAKATTHPNFSQYIASDLNALKTRIDQATSHWR